MAHKLKYMNNRILKAFWLLAKELAKENGISGFTKYIEPKYKRAISYTFENSDCSIFLQVGLTKDRKTIIEITFDFNFGFYFRIYFDIDYPTNIEFSCKDFSIEKCNLITKIQTRFAELIKEIDK